MLLQSAKLGDAGQLPSIVDHHVIVSGLRRWGCGIDHPSDTNHSPTVCAEIYFSAHRLRFRLVGEPEAELPVHLGLVGRVGVAEHGGDVAERGY
ncbi:hypothetical protein [Micromonospora sp. DT229]|uniref:hypothetical protein n=1 Tax=Micromonospora sp. DT229 TaxID=3393430 RepID=UPI003CF8853D